ncbi:protein angel homolog 1 isoform X2 [Clarias gariepinus]|uniref:protein angel homolog 1 isoform X2 n=1 Tax=Clarias gariepinus TaxID=13013 RepID=UPI00234C1C13|nr:protein angel homolog 1 isoform X2 [Clarias gariepinus]
MIGSLIYYGLFPLTQLFIRLSEYWWKHHPVIINGKAVCDGRARSCRSLNKQPAVLLDQWCNADTETTESPTRTPHERKEVVGLEESRSLFEIIEVVVEPKSKMEENERKICSADLKVPDPESLTEGDLVSVSECDKIHAAAHECKGTSSRQRFEGTMTETGADGAEGSDGSKVQLSFDPFTPENVYGSDLSTRAGEAQVSNGSLVYDLSELLLDSHEQSISNHSWLQPVPHHLHFPVGLGLSEEVYYPFQDSGASYYHGFQGNTDFEVMWRVWEDLNVTSCLGTSPPTASAEPESTFDFTVMSYNILAQDLLEANIELYTHCSEEVLAWENRLQNILKELQTWEPDIICLQEVQENHFQEQLYPALTEMGYDCVYKRRTGTKTDGCAVCYYTQRFTLLSVHLLEFQRHDHELLDRDNVGIVVLLQPTTVHAEGIKFRPICVANTHLLFNPRRGDVKLAQLAIMLAEIDKVVRHCQVKGHECEIILCGDFNALPNMPLYQLIVTGQLYYHGLPNWMVSGQEDLSYKTHHRRLYAPLWPNSLGINDNCRYCEVSEPLSKTSGKLQYNHDFLRQLRYCPAACVRPSDLELIPGVTDNTPTPEETLLFPPRHFRNMICHGLNLRSVYSQNRSGSEHCAITTLHSHGATMVDYIFYSTRREDNRSCHDKEKGLTLLGRLALLSEADLRPLNGLPNEIFPSDHLSLLAKFQLC